MILRLSTIICKVIFDVMILSIIVFGVVAILMAQLGLGINELLTII